MSVADPTLGAAVGPIALHVMPFAGEGVAPLRIAVPMPQGALHEPFDLEVFDAGGVAVPASARVTARWPDRSVKWMLADLVVGAASAGRGPLALRAVGAPAEAAEAAEPAASAPAHGWTPRWPADGESCLVLEATGGDALRARLRFARAGSAAMVGQVVACETRHASPVRADLEQRLDLADPGAQAIARWSTWPGVPAVLCELQLRNPRAARHPGGLWDLGDVNSLRIDDLSFTFGGDGAAGDVWARPTPEAVPQPVSASSLWCLYQDSSGGERWDSPNHVDADGRLGVRFRGWRIEADGATRDHGLRAQPTLGWRFAGEAFAVTLADFWQEFPKAIRWNVERSEAAIGLFPGERAAASELQPGEQKRHRVALAWGPEAAALAQRLADPPHAWVDPAWVERSGAVPGLVADLADNPGWTGHVRTIVDGPASFVERRERIDEYGWRHFGDLHADHETVHADADAPFPTHYNNQYDFVHSAHVHALRTGDPRWARLAREAARHTVDIDVYHTAEDRAAFNGGLFWHSDHYMTAGRATHRTYSAVNAVGQPGGYGGGPANEHNYGSGLLLHHWTTGDPAALEAVVGLADWVLAMDDGSRTLLGLIDAGPTGLASRTVDTWYHGPGRGAANSISALLDGWLATRRLDYLDAAEALVRRCIHPREDPARHGLDDIENRWSYLVLLQVLGKYLELKRSASEHDRMYHYARESLLRYADWILEHEVPYRDVLDRVEIPTESWPAHDIRKCHVLHLAARHAEGETARRYRERATFFFERCLSDLDAFPTRHLTRPLVVLAAYAHLHTAFLREPPGAAVPPGGWRHDHDFGEPATFRSQRERWRDTLRARLGTAREEVARLVRDRLARRRS